MTVLTVLMVAMEIMWVAMLLGMELKCEMIGIADSLKMNLVKPLI